MYTNYTVYKYVYKLHCIQIYIQITLYINMYTNYTVYKYAFLFSGRRV